GYRRSSASHATGRSAGEGSRAQVGGGRGRPERSFPGRSFAGRKGKSEGTRWGAPGPGGEERRARGGGARGREDGAGHGRRQGLRDEGGNAVLTKRKAVGRLLPRQERVQSHVSGDRARHSADRPHRPGGCDLYL